MNSRAQHYHQITTEGEQKEEASAHGSASASVSMAISYGPSNQTGTPFGGIGYGGDITSGREGSENRAGTGGRKGPGRSRGESNDIENLRNNNFSKEFNLLNMQALGFLNGGGPTLQSASYKINDGYHVLKVQTEEVREANINNLQSTHDKKTLAQDNEDQIATLRIQEEISEQEKQAAKESQRTRDAEIETEYLKNVIVNESSPRQQEQEGKSN